MSKYPPRVLEVIKRLEQRRIEQEAIDRHNARPIPPRVLKNLQQLRKQGAPGDWDRE